MPTTGKLSDTSLNFINESSLTNVKLTATTSILTYEGPSAATVLIKNLTDPVDPQDSATKAYVDSAGGTPELNQNQFLVGNASNEAADQGPILTFSTAVTNGPVFSMGLSTDTTATLNIGTEVSSTTNVNINLGSGTGSTTIDHAGSGSFIISASNSGQITLVQSGLNYLWPTSTPAANEVLTVSSFSNPNATLNWTSTGLSSAEYRQVKVSSDTTAPSNNAAIIFSTTAIVNEGSITNDGLGVFTLSTGKTYRLVARLGITNVSSGLSYRWYDNTNAQFVGVPGDAISSDNLIKENTVNDAIAVVSTSSSVELRILSGGTSTTIDATYSSVYIEKISDTTAVSVFTGSTTSTVGTSGLVPAPTTSEINYLLSSNGSWVTSPDTNPAGSNTQVQFNDGGVFGASADFTWDGTSLKLTDGKDFTVGTGDDLVITHSGTAGSITNTTGNLNIVNTDPSNDLIIKLGSTNDENTSFRVRDNSDNDRFYIEMDGGIFMPSLRTGISGSNSIGIISNEIVDTVSLRKYKDNEVLASDEPGYSVKDILKLEPKFFTWTESGTRDLGFVVEDALDKNLNQFIFTDPEKGPRNYKDRSLIAGLLALVQEHNKVIEKQNKVIQEQNKDIENLKRSFTSIKHQLYFSQRKY